MDTSRNHLLEDTRDRIARDVAAGFAAREQIVEMAIEYMRDDPDNEYPAVVLRRVAERMTGEVMNDHFRRQATWGYPTDCDRLDEAFEELSRAGLLARQHYSYHRAFASAEIRLEASHTPGSSGYVFYCEPDAVCAWETGLLYLSFGSVSETEAGTLAIGQQIVKMLRLVGLQTDWNGDLHRRIEIVLDWKYRRVE